MVRDERRVQAYLDAMRAVITRESFVLEIGTGIGLFAVLASQLGARRIVAIEPSDAIVVAREIAAANGVTNIEFVKDVSQNVDPGGRADVIVSDLRGMLPLYDAHIEAIVDARERLLAPGRDDSRLGHPARGGRLSTGPLGGFRRHRRLPTSM